MDRIRFAMFVPVAIVTITIVLAGSVGLLLLGMAEIKEKWLGVHEPFAVIVALLLSVAILGGAAFLSMNGPNDSK